MFNYIFTNYKKSTDPAVVKTHNTAFDFYRELGLSPPDPSIIDGDNEWFKRYQIISILRIDRYLKQNLTIEKNWNAVSDSDKQNCRIAIVQFIDWLLRNGQESSISITGSIAGQSFSKNTNLAKFELPPDVLIALEKVSFFSPLTSPAKLAASTFTKSQIDQIKAVFYDLFFSHYPATADVLANKLLENTIFLNKIKGPQGPVGPQGATGPAGKVQKYNINNNTLFSYLDSNINVGDIVNLIFDNTINNSVLHNKIFIGEIISKYDGDELFVGQLWNQDLKILYGDYTITTSEIFNNSVGTDKINWSNVVKITEEELKTLKANTYTKTETDAKLALKANAGEVYKRTELYTKTETDNKLANKATKTALNAQKTDLEAKIALKRDISDSYTKAEVDAKVAAAGGGSVDAYTKEKTDQKIAKLEGSGVDLHKIIPFQQEIEIATDVVKTIPHFTWPSATDFTTNKNYWINTIKTYGPVIGDYFKITFPTGWNLSRLSGDNIKVAGKTFLIKITIIPTIGRDWIVGYGYENGDTTKQKIKIDFGDYHEYSNSILYSINNRTISAEDWKPVGNVSATNKFIRKKDYDESAQSKGRFTNYAREFTTHDAMVSASHGISYELVGNPVSNGNSPMEVYGSKTTWLNNDTPPLVFENEFRPNFFKGFDVSHLPNSGETKLLPGAGIKKFFKKDVIHFIIHLHANILNKWVGLEFVFRDKNNNQLKTTNGIFSNDFLATNETYKFNNVSSTTKAHLMANLFKSKYSEWKGTIKFEEKGIYINYVGFVNQLDDINKISGDITIAYPTNFADDGLTISSIDCGSVNRANFEYIDNTIKFIKGTTFWFNEDIGNKQLGAVIKERFN